MDTQIICFAEIGATQSETAFPVACAVSRVLSFYPSLPLRRAQQPTFSTAANNLTCILRFFSPPFYIFCHSALLWESCVEKTPLRITVGVLATRWRSRRLSRHSKVLHTESFKLIELIQFERLLKDELEGCIALTTGSLALFFFSLKEENAAV